MKMIRGFQVRYTGPNAQFKVGRRWYGKDEVVRVSFAEARRAAHIDKNVVIERWSETTGTVTVSSSTEPTQVITEPVTVTTPVDETTEEEEDGTDLDFSIEEPAGEVALRDRLIELLPQASTTVIDAIVEAITASDAIPTVDELTTISGVGQKTALKVIAMLEG